jgi:hypothetical protein
MFGLVRIGGLAFLLAPIIAAAQQPGGWLMAFGNQGLNKANTWGLHTEIQIRDNQIARKYD